MLRRPPARHGRRCAPERRRGWRKAPALLDLDEGPAERRIRRRSQAVLPLPVRRPLHARSRMQGDDTLADRVGTQDTAGGLHGARCGAGAASTTALSRDQGPVGGSAVGVARLGDRHRGDRPPVWWILRDAARGDGEGMCMPPTVGRAVQAITGPSQSTAVHPQ